MVELYVTTRDEVVLHVAKLNVSRLVPLMRVQDKSAYYNIRVSIYISNTIYLMFLFTLECQRTHNSEGHVLFAHSLQIPGGQTEVHITPSSGLGFTSGDVQHDRGMLIHSCMHEQTQ